MANQKSLDRRTFIQQSVLAGAAGIAVPAGATETLTKATAILREKPKSRINLGFIGVGLRGQSHVGLALDRTDCDVVAICDIDDKMINSTLEMISKKGKAKPAVFKNGERGYLELLARPDIDAVIIATPWRWHSEMAIAAMKAGKYTGVEVCGGFSLDEGWQLVNTHEQTGVHLFFLENVCYRRDVMAILNMVRQDLFGEMVHLECGYQHDLRGVKFNDGVTPYDSGVEFGEKGFSEARWRTLHSVHRNGELYPTHGIGPVAMYTNINRGNRFLYLTSMATKTRGLHEYIVNHPKGGENHPNAKVRFNLGDIVTTLIKTSNGETVIMSHDTNLPRPYSLGFRVQGTKGLWMDVNKSLYIEGKSKPHTWEEAATWLEKYDHPLWKRLEHQAEGAGHGGMDFFLLNAFVECAKNNEKPPFDAYDAATWLSITPLSEASISMGSAPVEFPDFTRGRWVFRSNTFAMGDNY
ncbi:MAG TPA: Gfo/Idh/MocA family oxidoreductase [Flavilitoribacter sp.]|nr:Gfo/Idh/MocA family oxidoreductase [Flavilitoribacter sp.]